MKTNSNIEGFPGGMTREERGDPKRYPAAWDARLFFWVEYNPPARGIGPGSWLVVAASGLAKPTEAFDDWFANKSDAEEVAQKLAKGEI